jgi:pyruvate dehydrogenase E2 component (dihydrolipoamide acetyltransferase)
VVAPAPAAASPAFTAPGELYGLPARRRPTPAASGALAPGRAPVRQPLSRHRRALATLMTASATIPQFSVHRELPMAEAQRTVAALRRAGVAATVTDVLLRATALALVRHPELDGCLVDGAVEHAATPAISLAADSPSGVVAPVVRGAERLPWRELALERKRVVDGARRGRLLPADLTGGTFSISNVGALGGDLVIPMLTPPQIGILGVGRVRPGWGGTVAGAVLVADHRAVDGADSARFLATLAELLADPDALDGGRG